MSVKETLEQVRLELTEEFRNGTWVPKPGDPLSECSFIKVGFQSWGLEAADHSWRLDLSRLNFGDADPKALLTVWAPNHAEAFPDLDWLVFRHSVGTNGGTNFNSCVTRLMDTLSGGKSDGAKLEWARRLTYLIERARNANAGANNGTFATSGVPSLQKQMPFVFAGRIREGRSLSIYGPGGAGKTTLVDGLIVSAAAGIEVVPGWMPTRRFRCLVLDWDEGREEEEVRLGAICRAYGVELSAGFHYKRQGRPLFDVADEIGAYVVQNGIELVVISPMGKAQRNMGEVLTTPVDEVHEILRMFGTTNIIIDHVTGENQKGGAQREFGTVRKRDNVRGSYSLYPQEALCRPGSRSVVMENTKPDALLSPRPKHAIRVLYAPADPDDGIYDTIRFEQDEVQEGIVFDFGGQKLHEGFHEALVRLGHLSVEELGSETGRNTATVRSILNRFRGSYFNRLPSGKWEALPIPETERNNVS